MRRLTRPEQWSPNSVARRWLLVLGVWGAMALFSMGQIYVSRAALGEPPPLAPLAILEVPVWAFWALLTVPVVMFVRRFPLDRERAVGRIAIHGLAAIIVAVVAVAFYTLWYQGFNPYPLTSPSVEAWFWHFFRQQFIVGFMIYWAVIGVYHAFTNYFLYRMRELEASQAKAQLSEARLLALEMQLHPHFLFNTLNSISALVEEQPSEARRFIARLADLLRASLRSEATHVIPLEEEIEFVERYLEIEKMRFQDRLEVDVDVDPEVRGAEVPSFILQPLVENAIRHGIGRRERGGRLWLSAERRDGALVLSVRDDGVGMAEAAVREGIGLSNTRSRLRELYGHRQSLVLAEASEGGVEVHVEIPYRETRAAT